MRTIDTRGLSCPQPLVLFHQAIAENADTPLMCWWTTRPASKTSPAPLKKGWNVTPKDEGEGVFRLELRK